MFEKERTVDLSPWGYDRPARVKRLMWGEMKAMNRELNEIRRDDPQADEKAITTVMRYCLVDAPFGNNETAWDGADWEALAFIAKAAKEHNSPLVMKPSPSGSDSPTDTGHATLLS